MKRRELIKLLEPCDIIFSFKKDSFFSKLIWIFSKWGKNGFKRTPMISHTMLYLGNNLIVEAAIGGGVGIKNIRAFSKIYDIKIGRYKGKDLDREGLISYCTENAGIIKYAYFQLIAIFFKKILRLDKIGDIQEEAMHCSEFISTAFKKQGVDLVADILPAETSPLDIFNSPVVEIIYG